MASGALQSNSRSAPSRPRRRSSHFPSSTFSFYSATDTPAGKDTVETDTFLLEYVDGSLAALDVVSTARQRSGARRSPGPAAVARPLIVGVQAGAPVPVASLDAPLSAGLQFRVNQWAQAYARDNGTTLYQVTGDTSSRTYPGIGGLKVVGAPTITDSTQDGPKQPARLVVTVELTLESTSTSSVVEQVSYDLLITDLGHKYPNVVAWGPPGSGSTLTPYENAG